MFTNASSDIIQLDGLNSYISSVNSSTDGFSESLSSSYSAASEDDLGDSYYSQDVHFHIPVIINIHSKNVDNYPAPAWYEPVQKQFRNAV